ncbi:hypothetical protein M501DRAFT_987881 [Patellaria atrata CBS 101060]|uniref:DUF7908 domain-containing protein n=1 Tax=Patellaria atrata CBS 101060 TaxID=1346257 RepID=A0A9P4S4Y2_9PEZI|nr:hypothetical protein M501DRAFT_987881 [Patellaria atrata CBS 101060]
MTITQTETYTCITDCPSSFFTDPPIAIAALAPTPDPDAWSDSRIAAGAPFNIEVVHVDPSGWFTWYPPARSWLLSNGNTTTNRSRATIYRILNGRLSAPSGWVSTTRGLRNKAFAVSQTVGDVQQWVFTTDTMLNWTSEAFTGGVAQFYKLPPGFLGNARVLVKFVGGMQPSRGWSPIVLWAREVESLQDEDQAEER